MWTRSVISVVTLVLAGTATMLAPDARGSGGPQDAGSGPSSEGPAVGVYRAIPLASPSPAVPIEIEALIVRALEQHPRLKAARERLQSLRGRAAAAGALEQPTAGLSYQNDTLTSYTLGKSEFAQVLLSWMQPLPGKGKRALREQAARMSAEAAEPSLCRAQMDLRLEIVRTWWDLAYELEARATLAEQKDLVDQVESSARSLYSVGKGSQRDVLRAQVQRARLAEALAVSEGNIAALRLELRGDLLLAPDASLPEPGPLPTPGDLPSAEAAVKESLRLSPELAALERVAAAAETREELARSDYRPDYSVGGSYMYRGSLDPMVAVSVGIQLPIYRKARLDPALSAAGSEASEARSQAAALRILIETRVRQRLAVLAAAQDSARLLSEGVIPQDRLSLESAMAAYTTGQLAALSVLGELSALLQDKLEMSRRLLLIAGETARLDALSLDPPPALTDGMSRSATLAASAAPSMSGPAAGPPAATTPGGGSSTGTMP